MEFKAGQRVRRTYTNVVEGTVCAGGTSAVDDEGRWFSLDLVTCHESVCSVEILADPEPGPGSIVLDASGIVWRRHPDGTREFPWGGSSGARTHGGYQWTSGNGPAHPCRVLLDPTKEA